MHICVNVYPARPSVIIVRSAKVMARFGASSSLTSASEYMQYTPCAQMAMVMALPQIEPTTQNADGRLRTPAPRLERIKCIAAIQAEMPCTAEGVAAASGASVFIGADKIQCAMDRQRPGVTSSFKPQPRLLTTQQSGTQIPAAVSSPGFHLGRSRLERHHWEALLVTAAWPIRRGGVPRTKASHESSVAVWSTRPACGTSQRPCLTAKSRQHRCPVSGFAMWS